MSCVGSSPPTVKAVTFRVVLHRSTPLHRDPQDSSHTMDTIAHPDLPLRQESGPLSGPRPLFALATTIRIPRDVHRTRDVRKQHGQRFRRSANGTSFRRPCAKCHMAHGGRVPASLAELELELGRGRRAAAREARRARGQHIGRPNCAVGVRVVVSQPTGSLYGCTHHNPHDGVDEDPHSLA